MNKNKKYPAFSLAELLVALSILAIIAVMTVPALRDDAQKKENAAKVTKAYASLAQAFDYMTVKLPVSLWEADWADEQLKKQLNIVGGNCFAGMVRFPTGTNDTDYGDGNSYQLADGTCIKLDPSLDGGNDLAARWGMGTGKYYYSVYVDVNGKNRPNVWGQDVFLFMLTADRGLIPSGADNPAADQYGNAAEVIKLGKTE